MTDEEILKYVEKVLILVHENAKTHRDIFGILMTSLVVFIASNDPCWDSIMNGIEEELKKQVKKSRLTIKEAMEKQK
jgi:hypothetical protein